MHRFHNLRDEMRSIASIALGCRQTALDVVRCLQMTPPTARCRHPPIDADIRSRMPTYTATHRSISSSTDILRQMRNIHRQMRPDCLRPILTRQTCLTVGCLEIRSQLVRNGSHLCHSAEILSPTNFHTGRTSFSSHLYFERICLSLSQFFAL